MSDETVTLDNLEAAIANIINEYSDDVNEDVKDAAKVAAESAVSDLKANSPKSTGLKTSGEYAKAWTLKVETDTSNKASVTVYNKGHGQITHLLEKGHLKRNGIGWVDAIPHITPAAEDAAKLFEAAVKEVI